MFSPLPVDAAVPRIIGALVRGRNVVVEAPPGAGKTTRVPPALLEAFGGDVLVLEPRRIAARMAARRAAFERGERIGESVGYQVRFEEVAGPSTRLRFLTEGVFTRRLLSDPDLRGVTTVILDEFHERHLEGDLGLALLRRVQMTSRPDLRLAVMSATLDSAPVSDYLDGCPVVRSEGRLHDVAVSYAGHSAAPLEDQVASAVEKLPQDGGDILVFLPGAAEIRRAARACAAPAQRLGLSIVPLHGDLAPEEQDRAVQPGGPPKLILSTNVAESSITIEGVTTVIDSGLARIASDSPDTGLPVLEVRRISKASATQRAGRAGRVRPGRAVRLFTAEDFHRRPDHDLPEIRRRDLSPVLLQLRALGVSELPWFDAPPQPAWEAAAALLERLGGRDKARELARYPLHPRLARLLTAAAERGAAVEACRLAALLSSGDRYPAADALQVTDRELEGAARQIEKQLARLVRSARPGVRERDGLAMSILEAYPDRAGRRRAGRDARLANDEAALLPEHWTAEFFVAVDVEHRREHPAPVIRLAAPIEPEWLLELFPERIREASECVWNRGAERVDAVSRLHYDSLLLEENRGAMPDPQLAARLLAEHAADAGLQRFIDPERISRLLARTSFAAKHSPVRALSEDDVRGVLAELCAGCRSFAELERAARAGMMPLLFSKLGPDGERTLNAIAPDGIPLGKRQVQVHYEQGQQPWIASRLQDFFGLRDTPRIARGQVPLVVHLLAPNQRPVQTTSDLAGFWDRLYPQVRRELSRRYPKHAWPEKPA